MTFIVHLLFSLAGAEAGGRAKARVELSRAARGQGVWELCRGDRSSGGGGPKNQLPPSRDGSNSDRRSPSSGLKWGFFVTGFQSLKLYFSGGHSLPFRD